MTIGNTCINSARFSDSKEILLVLAIWKKIERGRLDEVSIVTN